MRDPPAGVQFHFDMEQMYPLAAVMLEEDQLLNRMRFDLVPKQSVLFLCVCVWLHAVCTVCILHYVSVSAGVLTRHNLIDLWNQ